MPPTSPVFLMWYDDARGSTLADRCADASDAYAARYGRPPAVLLVPLDAPDPLPERALRSPYVRPNIVWAGETTP